MTGVNLFESGINLFEIEEKQNCYGNFDWYLYASNYRKGILTDRTELIDLAMNILYFTEATKQEMKEVQERIKENIPDAKFSFEVIT
jgi:hypothetical protein